jgi:hypothetical protein
MVTSSGRINLESGIDEDQIQAAFQKAVEQSTPRVQQLVELQEEHIQYLYSQLETFNMRLQANEQMYGNAVLNLGAKHPPSLADDGSVSVYLRQGDAQVVDITHALDNEDAEDAANVELILTVRVAADEEQDNPEAEALIAELHAQTAAAVEAEEAEAQEVEYEYGQYDESSGEVVPIRAEEGDGVPDAEQS